MISAVRMGKAHGAFNVAAGLWPIVHLRSFEALFGPKADRWLEYTVAGLLVSIGYAQLRAAANGDWQQAQCLGISTAGTLLTIDLGYVPRGRIRWTYLIDAVEEITLIGAWLAVREPARA